MTDPTPEPHLRRPNDPENIVGRAIGGRYLVRRCISQGGMGVIYLARQEALDREVILKVVRSDRADEEAEARFRREARSLSLLSHTNIVQIFDHGYDDDTGLWFIVMEYVRGITLSSYRKRRGGILGLEEFLPIARQMLEGVAEAHRAGLLHRDLKPSNVMLTSPDGVRLGVKILDFGLSKLASGEEEQVTRANYFAGSVMYLAPELIKNKGVDARADVYSLGVIFYQLLTGQNPLQGDDPYQMLLQQVTNGIRPMEEALPPGHEVPPSLVQLVNECVAIPVERRPNDARAVLERLSGSLSHVVSNTIEPARAAATAQELATADVGTMAAQAVRTATGSRVRIQQPQNSRAGIWVALVACACVIVLMFATLGVLVALLVNNVMQQQPGLPTPVAVVETGGPISVAAEVLRQRALAAIRDGDYDRAVALTAEAMSVAPGQGDLEELLGIVTDLRDRQAGRAPAPAPTEPRTPVADAQRARPEPTPRPSTATERTSTNRPTEVERGVGIAVITSSPTGLNFEIPGVVRGVTPFRALDVPEGSHEVLFYRDGAVIHSARMSIPKNGVELLDVGLAAPTAAPTAAPIAAPEPSGTADEAPVVPAAGGRSSVYVYVPSANKPRVIQDTLAARMGGMDVSAYGSFRELKEAMTTAPPHAVIAPRTVLDALGLQPDLQGLDSAGSPTERYVLLGKRALAPTELGTAVIGMVDVAGRESSAGFVAKLLQTETAPQIKRVTEESDLLSLLQFDTADAILLPESAAGKLTASTQMQLVRTSVASGAGLPGVSVIDDARRGEVEAAVRALGSDANARVGVNSWGTAP